MDAKIVVRKALENKLVVPAFNIPHLPMVKPIVQAVVDENSVAMIQVARLEWEKFESESLERVAEEYGKYKKEGHTLLHLDHVPVIDEDHLEVDYLPIIERAIKAGYQSVMVDASRLTLEGNIAATKAVCDIAHAAGIPVEAELGAVMGHETAQAAIPYEEIFEKKMGFTTVEDATKFVEGSGCDWLSVAVGSVHGASPPTCWTRKSPPPSWISSASPSWKRRSTSRWCCTAAAASKTTTSSGASGRHRQDQRRHRAASALRARHAREERRGIRPRMRLQALPRTDPRLFAHRWRRRRAGQVNSPGFGAVPEAFLSVKFSRAVFFSAHTGKFTEDVLE